MGREMYCFKILKYILDLRKIKGYVYEDVIDDFIVFRVWRS